MNSGFAVPVVLGDLWLPRRDPSGMVRFATGSRNLEKKENETTVSLLLPHYLPHPCKQRPSAAFFPLSFFMFFFSTTHHKIKAQRDVTEAGGPNVWTRLCLTEETQRRSPY